MLVYYYNSGVKFCGEKFCGNIFCGIFLSRIVKKPAKILRHTVTAYILRLIMKHYIINYLHSAIFPRVFRVKSLCLFSYHLERHSCEASTKLVSGGGGMKLSPPLLTYTQLNTLLGVGALCFSR